MATNKSSAVNWVPLLNLDLHSVNQIADHVHTSLPERPDVFAEKLSLFPQGCRKLLLDNRSVGYGISHSWVLNSIPPLDEFLVALPPEPQCLYIHDVVVLPEARGHNASGLYVEYIKALAKVMHIQALALVSVYGTDVLWSRFGFQTILNPSLTKKLLTYGATAKYMICNLND
jgi:hypothetical protein